MKLGVSDHIKDDDRNLADFYRDEEAKCSEMHTESRLRAEVHRHGL